MKKKKLRLYLGGVFTLYFDVQGHCLCPVCGFPLNTVQAYDEWSESATQATDLHRDNPSIIRHKKDKNYMLSSGSLEICPSCKIQYGEDDFLDSKASMTQHKIWHLIRDKWLRDTTVDERIMGQLKNIGVSINNKGHQIRDINLE